MKEKRKIKMGNLTGDNIVGAFFAVAQMWLIGFCVTYTFNNRFGFEKWLAIICGILAAISVGICMVQLI